MTQATPSPQPISETTLVLPCLNEAGALPWLLERLPPGFVALVADNGSTDGSREVAVSLGARVIDVPARGYGAACHAGIEAAETKVVAVMDADATLDPADLPTMVAAVTAGIVDLAVCRRQPVDHTAWPWHARLGTTLLAWRLRSRTGLQVRDLGPVRVFRREPYLQLGITDRAFGYPMEVLASAAAAGWTVHEYPLAYGRRTGKSKVAGTVRGSLRAARDLWRAVP